MIKVVAKSCIRIEALDRVRELSREMVENTVKEEGCIKYELYQDIKDPKIMIFIEEWKDEEALNKHIASDHFKRIIPQLNELRERPSETNVCRRLC